MYSIIYWIGENEVYPLCNKNGTLYIAETLKEADEMADNVENNTYKLPNTIKWDENFEIENEADIEVRVISISSVKE